MNRTLCLILACLLVAAACSDDAASEAPVADAASPTSPATSSDAGIPATTAPVTPAATDGATPTSAPIPLLVWVDDLVDNHTHDDAIPDTVDDKNIADNEDPSAFDSRFK